MRRFASSPEAAERVLQRLKEIGVKVVKSYTRKSCHQQKNVFKMTRDPILDKAKKDNELSTDFSFDEEDITSLYYYYYY